MIYNATYMIPETLVLMLVAFYLGQCVDLTQPIPRRIVRTGSAIGSVLRLGALGVLFAGLIFDIAKVFSVLQDPESGEFNITGLTEAGSKFYITLIVVSAVCIVFSLVVTILSRKIERTEKTDA